MTINLNDAFDIVMVLLGYFSPLISLTAGLYLLALMSKLFECYKKNVEALLAQKSERELYQEQFRWVGFERSRCDDE